MYEFRTAFRVIALAGAGVPISAGAWTVRQCILLIDHVWTLGGIRWGDLDRQDQYEAPLELRAEAIHSHFEQPAHADERQGFINFSMLNVGCFELRNWLAIGI